MDIGGNCGFFTFEAIEKGAKKVHYWEGNKTHCDFVELASEVLGCAKKINIINAYYDFKDKGTIGYDVVFLLNVLHHLGDDYGDSELSIDAAKEHMAIQLNSMAAKTKFIIFQLGFCWKGNRDIGLFKNGTKKELISYVTELVKGVWEVRNIGIPVMEAGKIVYVDIDDQNILRNDTLGEFLNRPLFVLEAN